MIVGKLITLADKLDNLGLIRESDYLDTIIKAARGKSMADVFEEMEGPIGSVFGRDVSEAAAQRLQRLDINELTYRMSWGSDDFDQNTKT